MQVIDKTGKVYLSTAWYPLVDPTTGNVYQPGELVQVNENAWIKGQPTMVDQNPDAPLAPLVQTRTIKR